MAEETEVIPEIVVIVLPPPAKVLSPNCHIASLRGRYMKAAAAKRYRRIAKEAVEAERIETAPWDCVRVEVAFYHTTRRDRDQDNAMGSLKAVYDGIVDAGLVAKDTPAHMQRGLPEFRIDKECPRVVLTLTRC